MKRCASGFPVCRISTVFWSACGVTNLASAENSADALARGAEIFAANCATCHGPAGGPDPDSPLVKSLGVVPANFADVGFFEGW